MTFEAKTNQSDEQEEEAEDYLPVVVEELYPDENSPILTGKWRIAQRITTAFFSSLPAALMALPAGYGSAMFSEKIYPPPWNWFIGAGIESSYIGLILFARKKSFKSFVLTALMALLCGVIYNSLHAAEVSELLMEQNSLVKWLLSVVHGSPLSLLAFSYFLLLHASSDSLLRYVKGRRGRLTTTTSSSPAKGSSPLPVSSNLSPSPVASAGSQLQPVGEVAVSSTLPPTSASLKATSNLENVSEKGRLTNTSNLPYSGSEVVSSSATTLFEVATNHSQTTSILTKYSQGQGQENGPEVNSLAYFTAQVSGMARQVQLSKLGVRQFESRLHTLLDGLNPTEPALAADLKRLSLDQESGREELVEQLRRMARQIQKRELGVKEFDRQLMRLVAPQDNHLVQQVEE